MSGSVPSNPAADFAAKAKQAGNKVSGGAISNPARDFANAVRNICLVACNPNILSAVSTLYCLPAYSL